jgi:hypothetical protein
MYKTALSVSAQAAEKIRKCLAPCETALACAVEMAGVSAELGIPATMKALETIQKNPQLLQQEGKPIAQVVREAALESGVPTSTVWDSIKVIDPMYPNTRIPKSFEIAAGGKRFWVAPNATKHMKEYILNARKISHRVPMNSQALLASFQASIKQATERGILYTEAPIIIGNWELMLSQPRANGLLPVIKHAVYRP